MEFAAAQRNQEAGAPAWRPSSCSSSSVSEDPLAVFQFLQLGIPVVNVRDVVFHPGGHVKSTAPEFLNFFLLLGNLDIGLRDGIQDLSGPRAPVLLRVRGILVWIRWLASARAFFRRLATRYATFIPDKSSSVYTFALARAAFYLGFARGFRERIFFLGRGIESSGLSLGGRFRFSSGLR